jgi:hypothetical protein
MEDDTDKIEGLISELQGKMSSTGGVEEIM